MFVFTVNDQICSTDKDVRLIDFLRKDLGLTGTKEGCGSGACGTCTVIVDGRKTRACIPKTSSLAGKSVVTIEGLSDREKAVYAYSFAEAGAVQCGFCIPGMVMSAKCLLDTNPDPTRNDVVKAISGNICRCTGYAKIEQAILIAAELLRSGAPIPEIPRASGVGASLHRVDAAEKVCGTGKFADDFTVPGMIYAKALRSPYPRAGVDRINIVKALAHPDCVTVLTASDVPFNKTGHIVKDWDVLIAEGSITRYIGDAIVLAASEREESLDEILALVEVEYTVLEPVTSPAAALKEDAPKLHPNGNVLTHEYVDRGDADKAIAEAAFAVTTHYSTPQTDHAFMEPECAVAIPKASGIGIAAGGDPEEPELLVYTASQSVYDEQREIAAMLKIPNGSVRCRSMLVGGGFGGKEDMSVQHHAALMAWKTGRPVKVKFSRQESLNVHVKRHAMEIDITTACDAKGNITATKVLLISDCGAYASLGGPVLQRACTHAGGPYHFENFKADGYCVYTNNVPGGAFRGFGVTQSCFAQEMNITLLAEKAGIDPWEFRRINAIRPGETLPNGQIASEETAFVECLDAVRKAYLSSPFAGIAGCMKNSGLGVGLPDFGRTTLRIKDGIVHVRTSAADMGQGIGTVAVQIVCETAGIPSDLVFREAPDTFLTPNSGTTTASRQTLFCGEATRKAALLLKEALQAKTLGELEGEEFYGEYSGVTDPMRSDKKHPVSHVAYGYGAQVVIMDETKRVVRAVAAHDVGRAVNPKLCEGQIEGGIAMGLGFALTENFITDNGYVKSKYNTLGLLRSTDVPPIEVILIGKAEKAGLAYGAKGIGEISSVAAAPAAAAAAYRTDGIVRTSLPLANTAYKPNR